MSERFKPPVFVEVFKEQTGANFQLEDVSRTWKHTDIPDDPR